MQFSFSGHDRMLKAILEANKRLVKAVESAAFREAQIEMTEMKRRTPVEFGALRSSGHVERPVRREREIIIRFVFGGPAAPYAVYVHEDLDAWHEVGQAKFMESVLFESGPYFMERVARRLDLNKAPTPAQYGVEMNLTVAPSEGEGGGEE